MASFTASDGEPWVIRVAKAFANGLLPQIFTGFWAETTGTFDDALAGKQRPSAISACAHWFGGLVRGAPPDGRYAKEALADGSTSPMRGRETRGPTHALRSASKIDHSRAVDRLVLHAAGEHIGDLGRVHRTCLLQVHGGEHWGRRPGGLPPFGSAKVSPHRHYPYRSDALPTLLPAFPKPYQTYDGGMQWVDPEGREVAGDSA
jgi:hypothetical protein